MTARKTQAAQAYDYVQALFAFGKFGYITHGESGHLKRVLRKLAKEAAEQMHYETVKRRDNETTADRIAKALVP